MPALLLNTQYRMHPAISEWPSSQFYEGRVKSGVTPADRPPLSVSTPRAPLHAEYTTLYRSIDARANSCVFLVCCPGSCLAE